MKKKLPKFFDRIKVMHNKDYAASFRQQPSQKYLYDYTVNNLCDHLGYVRKNFHNAAFIGYNPETFVQNLPPNVTLENLMVCDYSIKNLEISLDLVEKYKKEKGLNFGVHPICLEEEIWPMKPESLDLVVSSLSLHWTNDVSVALVRILDSLVPDGALIGTIFGEETVQELRIAFTLAENERSGGVSQHASPMFSNVDWGNMFTRCQYNLPTIYSDKIQLNFNNPFELMQFIQEIGENNSLLENRKEVIRDVVFAAAAIYQNLFKHPKNENQVFSTFEFISFLGWKYHESQQKPKKRGSAEFSLKDLQKEIEDSLEPSAAKITSTIGAIEVSDSDSEDATKKGDKKENK